MQQESSPQPNKPTQRLTFTERDEHQINQLIAPDSPAPKEIKIILTVGEKRRLVHLSPAVGSNGSVHVYIDQFFDGQIVKRGEQYYYTGKTLTREHLKVLRTEVQDAWKFDLSE